MRSRQALISLAVLASLPVGRSADAGIKSAAGAAGQATTATATAPESPRQHAKWQAPKSDVPGSMVSATAWLFDHGMADPRGCDYREVSIKSGIRLNTDQARALHAWVIPAPGADGRSYAICWDGLAYPIDQIGPPVDLNADVSSLVDSLRTRLAQLPATFRGLLSVHWPFTAPQSGPGIAKVAILLRLGDGARAASLWSAINPERAALNPQPDPFETLGRDFEFGRISPP
jgi:hypothetical protein